VNEAITYHKGALIMLELEGMIGPDAMKEALIVFAKKRKGKPSSWNNLLEVFAEVCGADVSLWLKDKIST
jgi:aminopeptidase N